MTAILAGVPPAALPAWRALQQGLDDADHEVPCTGRADIWGAEPGHTEAIEYAQQRCRLCPVLAACDTYATAARESDGVWGGRLRTIKVGRPARTDSPLQEEMFSA